MNTQNRTKSGTKPPVTSHPLFPAIVALWFGALFGLGSLAVRVSLIESLIIASHIDVIVPMAAPPLGMTARILLALIMGIIGVGAGAALARRINRPKPVARSRRRTTGNVGDSTQRKPVYASPNQGAQAEDQLAKDKAGAMRRRALASDEPTFVRAHRDDAPLPGGAPQILDVTQFDLATPGSFEAVLPAQTPDQEVAEAPLDLTGFASPQTALAEPAEASVAAEPELAEQTNVAPPEPVIESYGDDTDSFRAKFANVKQPVEWVPEPPPGYAESLEAADMADDAPEFAAAQADPAQPRRFDPAPGLVETESLDEAADTLNLTEFAAPIPAMEGPAMEEPAMEEPAMELTEAFAPAADYAAPPSEVAAPALRRFDGPAATSAPAPAFSPLDFAGLGAAAEPRASEPAMAAAAFVAEPAAEAATAPVLAQDTAAQRIASTDLAELSPVELVERFAMALKQRRHTGAFPAGLAETAAALDLPLRPQPSQVSEVLAAMTPPVEPVVVAAPQVATAVSLAAEPVAVAAPLFAAPPAARSEVEAAPVAATPAALTLPAAMRPIEFGNLDEHEDVAEYAPPRSFAMPRMPEVADLPTPPAEIPAEIARPEAVPVAASASPSPAEPEAEPDVNEEGYSSLLALTKAAPLRQTFVRIDEPESEFAQVEPVVIFPGQSTRPGTRFARPGDPAAAAQPAEAQPASAEIPQPAAPGLRRFDAPSGAVSAAAAGAGAAQDPAEAERALRSALATLQRMSGAA